MKQFHSIAILATLLHFSLAYSPHRAITRRVWFVGSLASSSALLLPVTPISAVLTADSLQLFDDPVRGFSLMVPSEWIFSNKVLRDRRELLLWQDPTDGRTALTIAYTPIRDDFTSLASFGSVDQVAAQTILPKGALAGFEDDPFAKMLSATSAKQAYFFDYRQTVPLTDEGTPTHFRAIFALQQGATGGAGSMLVTITAQTPESRYPVLQKTLDAIVDSFGKSKTA
ncbi:hypothetical protein FisN_29Lh117 [Fistulifera solaris]|uniref:PsbP C-terminal domain-containing protein n=1 Tax=Fistulifera solaris TaxID=1519565 RepID=A0A1Z5JM88_FISSO|nr:hypothetical protein FisN_29Lh117 [Fistulifera solaris]|eukprot:GAX14898.1 hypothetical protein FisN_29Lh117 [Fistulifera solaris]